MDDLEDAYPTDFTFRKLTGAINNESFDEFVNRIFDMASRGKDTWLKEDLVSFLRNNKGRL